MSRVESIGQNDVVACGVVLAGYTTVISQGTQMPSNGEISKTFGVYKALCCDAEIVVAEGVEFPDCPNHPGRLTVWNPVAEEPINRTKIKKPRNSDRAA
jgi:hypothetical protein